MKVLPLIRLAKQHALIWVGWLKKSRHVEKVKSSDIDKQKQQQSTFRQNLPIGLGFRILFLYIRAVCKGYHFNINLLLACSDHSKNCSITVK